MLYASHSAISWTAQGAGSITVKSGFLTPQSSSNQLHKKMQKSNCYKWYLGKLRGYCRIIDKGFDQVKKVNQASLRNKGQDMYSLKQ